LDGRVVRYVFLSTGQVYLVRNKLPRPFIEDATESPITEAPPAGTRDHEEWLYGVEKSQAEDVLVEAWQRREFPFTTLRLPMVNSERDHFQRIYSYLLRMQDGGPILIPSGEHLSLRHVYAQDVIQAITRVLQMDVGKGRVYNISQDETVSIEDFLSLLAKIAGLTVALKRLDRNVLESHQFIPDCSPFSDPWMSELDNQRSKIELGMSYTPLPLYLEKLVAYYTNAAIPLPDGYRRRQDELKLASDL
jgi:nucleoside-diphosphate-sugar epimerase